MMVIVIMMISTSNDTVECVNSNARWTLESLVRSTNTFGTNIFIYVQTPTSKSPFSGPCL
jgi:hypothetical protein